MKIKIITLILILFTLCGCSNYNELNDLAIVSAMGIEKENKEFKITLEVFKEDKQSDQGAASKKSINLSGNGKSIDEAINDAAFMSEKLLFFTHLQAIIIDKNLANDGIKEIMDYLSRHTDFSFQTYVVLSDEKKPSEILEKKEIKSEIIGDSIYAIFNNTKQNNSAIVMNKYFDFLEQYINPREDIYLPYIKIKDKKISIQDVGVFREEKLVNNLNLDNVKTLSLFTGNTNSLYYRIDYNNDYIVMRVFEGKIKYKISKEKITIEVETNSGLDEVNCDVNTVKTENIDKINNTLEKSIKKDIEKFLKQIKKDNSDVLGLNDKIYKKFGKINKDWKDYDIEIKVNSTITKKGVLMNSVRDKS